MGTSKFLPIGKIVGVHGIKGTCRVYSYSESISVFDPDHFILVRKTTGVEKKYHINWIKPHNRVILICFAEIADIESAKGLVGSEILMERARLPELEEGTYYWSDLIGLSVFSKENINLGTIESIIPTGSNDVYVVKKPGKKPSEILVPALRSVILDIDITRQMMHVDLPEGL